MSYSQTIANWELPGITLKWRAYTRGGEYSSPCPDCGGVDRFRVQPNRGSNGGFWCRQCGKKGDLIDFLRWTKGMSFKEACDAVGKPLRYKARVSNDSSSFKKSKTPIEVQLKTRKRRIYTDLSWLKPKTPKESQFKPQTQEAERLTQQIDEAIKPTEKEIQQTPVETHAEPKSPPSPRTFLKQCKNCANFDIEDGIAWCFNGNSYRNHQHLKSCTDYEIPRC